MSDEIDDPEDVALFDAWIDRVARTPEQINAVRAAWGLPPLPERLPAEEPPDADDLAAQRGDWINDGRGFGRV